MPQFNISFSGLDSLRKEFQQQEKNFIESYGNIRRRDFWVREVRPYLVEQIKDIFRKEGLRGMKWPNLNPQYARRKQKIRTSRSSKKLRLHDAYFRTLTKGNQRAQHFLFNDEQMEYGIDLDRFEQKYDKPYPVYHEKGTSKMKPRRVFAQIPRIQSLEEDLQERAQNFFFGQRRFFTR